MFTNAISTSVYNCRVVSLQLRSSTTFSRQYNETIKIRYRTEVSDTPFIKLHMLFLFLVGKILGLIIANNGHICLTHKDTVIMSASNLGVQ